MPKSFRRTVAAQDFSPAYIRRSLEASLQRLRSDYVDVYQLHSPPRGVIERAEFVPVLERLQQEGKLRYWGIACETAEDATIALRSCPGLCSLQVSVSLLHPEALDQVVPQASKMGAAVTAHQVFASGLLTRSASSMPDQVLGGDARASLADLERQAHARGCTLAELALSFVLGQPGISVALLGMYRPEHLRQSLRYLAAASGGHAL